MPQYDNYYTDGRVVAGEMSRTSPIKSIDEKRMVATVLLEMMDEEEGDFVETEYELPVTYGVCPTCDGKGKHVNPSIDCNGLSADDFREDPDFAEAYLDGVYDVTCYGCGGKRVVPVIDEKQADPKVLKAYREHRESQAAYQREAAAERRMGC